MLLNWHLYPTPAVIVASHNIIFALYFGVRRRRGRSMIDIQVCWIFRIVDKDCAAPSFLRIMKLSALSCELAWEWGFESGDDDIDLNVIRYLWQILDRSATNRAAYWLYGVPISPKTSARRSTIFKVTARTTTHRKRPCSWSTNMLVSTARLAEW